MTTPPGASKTFTAVAGIAGAVAGALGVWFTLTDRLEKANEKRELEIETRVKKDITVETRIARLEERIASLQTDVASVRDEQRAQRVQPKNP